MTALLVPGTKNSQVSLTLVPQVLTAVTRHQRAPRARSADGEVVKAVTPVRVLAMLVHALSLQNCTL